MAAMWIILIVLLTASSVTGKIINEALFKPAHGSSSYLGDLGDAQHAVDGNNTSVYPNLFHTDPNNKSTCAWWWVDLQTQVHDVQVKIYFRTGYKYRRNGVQLYTSKTPFTSFPDGQLCYKVVGQANGNDIPDVVTVTCPSKWRYLMVYTETNNDGQGPTLDFGEVEVLECTPGTYGNNCKQSCKERHCVIPSDTCDHVTGTCEGGCDLGWSGSDCTQECTPGTYGNNCKQSCKERHCVIPSDTCDHVTGACEGGCDLGWSGSDCTQECTPGTYGNNCKQSCKEHHCVIPSDTCDHVTGACEGGCDLGWSGSDCTQECTPGTYGNNCKQSCKERHCVIPSDTCDHVTGACEGGCDLGWSGSDCTQECTPGTYGNNCKQSCKERHCVIPSDTCDHVTGACEGGCDLGWSGSDCTQECTPGTYGNNCKQSCKERHCVIPSDTCDHVTGACEGGCDLGWSGSDCTQECTPGTYGNNCKQSCKERHCVIPSDTCDHVTGACEGGCDLGWSGSDCTQVTHGITGIVAALVGAGAVFAVCAVVFICLIKCGKLHFTKASSNTESSRSPQIREARAHETSITEMTEFTSLDRGQNIYCGLDMQSRVSTLYETGKFSLYENI